MAIETELKLRIAPEHLTKLKRHPFLRSLSSGRASTRKLYSIYFDTPDLQLHHEKMALRLRLVGKQWIQTMKGGGGVQAGLHQRNEWETPVTGEYLDFDSLDAMGATPLPQRLRKKIQPVFITDFNRSIRLLKFEGALIELGLDSGEIRAGKSKYPISELELELKAGDPLQLFRLALSLLDIVPLEIETTSKAEYGYRLNSPVNAAVSKVQITKLDRDIPVKDALQSKTWSCLNHLQSNIPGAIKKSDVEYLHQVRISLRRLRIVMIMAKIVRTDEELDSLWNLVSKLGMELGRSREWDVFVTEILPSISNVNNANAKSVQQILAREGEKHRLLNYQLVFAALQNSDFQRLLLRFGAWMNGDYWKGFSYKGNLVDFSEKLLRTYTHKIVLKGQCVNNNDVNHKKLHKLRIACKNLRYSTELFSSILGISTAQNRTKLLISLQDTLGALNDNAVALYLLDELNKGAKIDNISLIKNEILSCHSKYLKRLQKEWKHFLKLATD